MDNHNYSNKILILFVALCSLISNITSNVRIVEPTELADKFGGIFNKLIKQGN